MSEPTTPPVEPSAPAAIRDMAPRPPGLFPRHLQTWFVAGIAGLIVLVTLLTGQQAPTRSTSTAPKPPATVDANQVRIQQYRDQMEEQVRRLQAEQANLALAKQSLARAAAGAGAAPSGAGPTEEEGSPATVQRTLEQDQAQRAYRALYADNLAWTARGKDGGAASKVDVRDGSKPSDPSAPSWPVGLPPALTAALTAAFASSKLQTPGQGVPGLGVPPQAPTSSPSAGATPLDQVRKPAREDANPSGEPTFSLLEGTVIDAVLTNRLDGSSAGPVNAMVTAPVYARDFQHVLIPRGSRVLGSASPVTQLGQRRLAVAFHRLIFPDGRSMSLDKMPALNQRGDVGLRDQVDQHFAQIFGASLAIGALAGLAQVNTGVGLDQSWTDAYRQGVGSSVTQSSMRILDRFLNQLPTVTIREGHRLKVYLTSDLALPAYRDEPAEPTLRR